MFQHSQDTQKPGTRRRKSGRRDTLAKIGTIPEKTGRLATMYSVYCLNYCPGVGSCRLHNFEHNRCARGFENIPEIVGNILRIMSDTS